MSTAQRWSCCTDTTPNRKREGKSKVHPRTRHEGQDGGYRHSSSFSLTSALVAGWVVNATHRPLTPRKWTRHPLYRRPHGHQGRSGRVRKISPPPGLYPQTFQPVASRYIDCAMPAPSHTVLLQMDLANTFTLPTEREFQGYVMVSTLLQQNNQASHKCKGRYGLGATASPYHFNTRALQH